MLHQSESTFMELHLVSQLCWHLEGKFTECISMKSWSMKHQRGRVIFQWNILEKSSNCLHTLAGCHKLISTFIVLVYAYINRTFRDILAKCPRVWPKIRENLNTRKLVWLKLNIVFEHPKVNNFHFFPSNYQKLQHSRERFLFQNYSNLVKRYSNDVTSVISSWSYSNVSKCFYLLPEITLRGLWRRLKLKVTMWSINPKCC